MCVCVCVCVHVCVAVAEVISDVHLFYLFARSFDKILSHTASIGLSKPLEGDGIIRQH